MKITLSKSQVALAGVVAASVTLAGGCCSGKKEAKTTSTTTTYSQSAPVATSTSQSSSAQTSEINVVGETNAVIPLHKESASISKHEVDAGSVRVRKVVKTETVSQPMELRHEEIEIQRIPAGSETASSPSGSDFQEQTTVIHLSKEEPVIQKQTASAGQVVVKAHTESMQTNVQAQVRSEDVAVDKTADASGNVTVSQGVQGSGEPMGAAESPGGSAAQTAPATYPNQSVTRTILDPTILYTSVPGSITGSTALFQGLKVKAQIDEHVVQCAAYNDQAVYLYSAPSLANLKIGASIDVDGIVRTGSADLTGKAGETLSSQPAYVEAKKIRPAQ